MPTRIILKLAIGQVGKFSLNHIIIDPDVIRTIQSETARLPYSECAGLLLGFKENNGELIRIIKSHGDGPNAEQTSCSVSPDVGFFNKLISKAEREDLEFIGEWHRHLGTFSTPSQGDVSAIEQIMKVNNLQNYVAIIITGFGENIEINPYIFEMVPTYEKAAYQIQPILIPKTPCAKPLDEPKSETKINVVSAEGGRRSNEEHIPLSTRFARKIRSYFSGKGSLPLPKNDVQSAKKEENHPPTSAWYKSDIGKRRLLLEKRMMNQHFPDFSLFKKGVLLFWSGFYKGYRIVLTYPEDYPTEPIIIELSPALRVLPDERDCLYAVLATQTAYLRIENAMQQPERLECI